MEMEEEKEQGGDGRNEEVEERGEDGTRKWVRMGLGRGGGKGDVDNA